MEQNLENNKVIYKVTFIPAGHSAIEVYTMDKLDDAIKAALGIYGNFPIQHTVEVTDNAGCQHLIMFKYV